MIKTIAETAWHHDGDFDFMNNLIDKLLNDSDADYIKLHITIDFDEYILSDHPGYDFLKEKIFDEKQWSVFIQKINASEKQLMMLFNDSKAIEFGMQFNPSLVEIHSVCLNDIHLLESLKNYKSRNIPIVLGVGGSTLYEIENAISFLETDNIILMHGFQNYPTDFKNVNLSRIRKIMNLYPDLKHGYADHTAWDEPNNNLITIMAASQGMNFVEKHVTTVPGEERIDWQAAIPIDKFNTLANDLKLLSQCYGDGLLMLNEGETKYSVFGPNKKAAFLQKDLKKGDLLRSSDIVFKRTGQISNTSQTDVWRLIGAIASHDIKRDTLITKDKFD